MQSYTYYKRGDLYSLHNVDTFLRFFHSLLRQRKVNYKDIMNLYCVVHIHNGFGSIPFKRVTSNSLFPVELILL